MEQLGISIDELVKAGVQLLTEPPPMPRGRVETRLRRGILGALDDVNVGSLVLGALTLDELGRSGMLPTLSAEEFMADPVNLVADEAIGTAIADYIAGTLGVHNFRYYDRMKPGILGRLPPFTDDAMCGLVGGVMSAILRGTGGRPAGGPGASEGKNGKGRRR